MGLDITGSKEFKPHLTILKLSRAPALRRMRLKAIIYKEYEDFSFGVQTFTRIDLCAMRKTQASGYYQCESSLVWGSSEASVGELTSCSEVTMVTSESVACVGETQDCSSDQDQPLSSLRVTSCAEQDSVHGSVLKETVNSRHASAADLGRDIDDKVHGESTGISTKPEDLERACAKTTD
ncbi:A-kinase anchor protein 7 isoform X1 [Amia ocellicauda]|uniref:A-kinase anchor protein 7 isoform X1 n=1 Tax=Amia ocellicauda TaxID=2972642 RepID=UPI003463BDC0